MSGQTVNVDKETHDLIAALKDQDADVRRAAARALGKVGPAAKDATTDLIVALRDREALRGSTNLAFARGIRSAFHLCRDWS